MNIKTVKISKDFKEYSFQHKQQEYRITKSNQYFYPSMYYISKKIGHNEYEQIGIIHNKNKDALIKFLNS